MKKVLVTGGAGYIGSHTVVELIESGYAPVIVDNFCNSERKVLDRLKKLTGASIPFYEVDINDRQNLEEVFKVEKNIDSVIHFAAYKAVGESVEKPLQYYKNNVQGLITLLEVMSDVEIRKIVFSSSCTVYGEPDQLPVNESFPRVQAKSPYGNTKIICEQILEQVSAVTELSAVILRYFNPIGAHPSALIGELPIGAPNNLVPYITQTAAGIRETLTVFGNDYNTPDGTCIRDYIHVVDLAKAHVKALGVFDQEEKGKGFAEIFNVGTGNGNSVMEIIETFENITGEKLNYRFGPRRSGDVEKIYAEVTKVQEDLGWKAQYNIKDALTHSWNWQKKL